MARNSKNKGEKANNKKTITKLAREDKLAAALKKNIKLRKEKKITIDRYLIEREDFH